MERHEYVTKKIHRFSQITIGTLLFAACATTPSVETPPERVPGTEGVPERTVPESPLSPREQPGPDPITPVPEEVPEIERMRIDAVVERVVASMTLEERAGQLIMPAILSTGNPTAVTPQVKDLIDQVRPGGIILFGPNLETPGQTRALVMELQALSLVPLFVAVDQEGGLVDRLSSSGVMGATRVPSAAQVGATGDADLAFELARVVARELRSLGINMNLAPVADIQTNAQNPVIGTRAYGNEPDLVAEMVGATVRGFHRESVIAVLKHFPGHGDTTNDTHNGAASVAHSLDRLYDVEFVPFVRGIESGADVVMTAHVAVPAVQGNDLPATFSRTLITDLLRGALGFDGVVMTDALMMGALVNYYREDEIILRAVSAGSDLLLRPSDPRAARDLLVSSVESGEISLGRLNESVARIVRLKFERGLMVDTGEALSAGGPLFLASEELVPVKVAIGIEEHMAVVEEIRRRSR